jgi:hypothetical protein
MRLEPTTAQDFGSIVRRTTVEPTIGQAFGCIAEHITAGPSLGGLIGRRLLGAFTGLAFTDRVSSALLVQEISPGIGGASRSETR